MKQSSSMIKSRASKPKNHKWRNVERFSIGHDQASLGLLPEHERMRHQVERSIPGGVWRSETARQTANERIFDSAQRLLKSGRASSVDEAVEKATQALQSSWGSQLGTETIVEAR